MGIEKYGDRVCGPFFHNTGSTIPRRAVFPCTKIQTGAQNTANGYNALYFNKGGQNTASGYHRCMKILPEAAIRPAAGRHYNINKDGTGNTASAIRHLIRIYQLDNTAVGLGRMEENYNGVGNTAVEPLLYIRLPILL